MPVRDHLERVANERQGRVFAVDSKTMRAQTYDSFLGDAERMAEMLAGLGLQPGSRLMTWAPNSLELAKTYFAALLAECTLIPLNSQVTETELRSVISQLDPDAIVADEVGGAELLRHGMDGTRAIVRMDAESGQLRLAAGSPPDRAPWKETAEACALVLTSGTTGTPTGILHSFEAFANNAQRFALHAGLGQDNRFFGCLSMSYMAGFYNLLLLPYFVGSSVVIGPAFGTRSALTFWDDLEKHEVDTLWLVPTILSMLLELDRGTKGEAYCRRSVKRALVGTAPLANELRSSFEARYGVRLLENYGLSECLLVSSQVPGSRGGGVGRPLSGIGIEMRQVAFANAEAPAGQEVLVASPDMMIGTYDVNTGTVKPMPPDGLLETGDLGEFDRNGELTITGRLKDLIIRGGQNISPVELEGVVAAVEGVAECAVIGVSHPINGEDVAVVVRTTASAEWLQLEASIRAACAAHLAPYKQPAHILSVDDLPRTASGKVKKRTLRALIEAQIPGTRDLGPNGDGYGLGADTRIVDLSLPLHDGMVTFPVSWHPRFESAVLGRHAVEGRETRRLVLGTHTGTHCDAPRHFIPGGATVDELPLEVFVGQAVVLNFTEKRPLEAVSRKELAARLDGHAEVSRALLRFGWDKHWETMEYYRAHPYLTVQAAHYLVDRGVRLIGMDTPMPDDPRQGQGRDIDSPIHKILLGAGVVLVEYLAGLTMLEQETVLLAAAPLRIRGADGSPMRCFAIETRRPDRP